MRTPSSKVTAAAGAETVPSSGGTIRTSISISPLISRVAALLEEQGGFNSFSDYVTELVRRDAQRGITSFKLPRSQWENLSKAA